MNRVRARKKRHVKKKQVVQRGEGGGMRDWKSEKGEGGEIAI